MATSSSPARSFYLQPLATLVLIVAILYLAKAVIVPLALAVLLTFVLTPVVASIQNRGFTRVPAVLLTVFLAFCLFGLVGWGAGVQIHKLARELPTHRKEIDAKIAGLRGSGEGVFSDLLQMLREISKGETRGEQSKPQAETSSENATPHEKVVLAQPQGASSFEQLIHVAGSVLEPLADAGLVLILVIFMLIKREDLRNRFIGLLGHERLTGTTRVLVDAAQRLSRFLLTQLLINVGFGALFATSLVFIGVPYAFLWGFLTAVLRFVPYIGSWLAVAFPLILSFAIAPSWTQPILVIIVFALLDVVTASVVEPLLFGHGTGVSPIALLIAAAFWTWIWGPIGLVLSTPLTVCLVVLGQHVPRLRFFALLLGDKPALAPHVSYYQRLLARDQREAEQVALAHAQEHGQEAVYDDVLLPALALARRDRKDAGLSADDESFLFQATRDILDHLASELAPVRDNGEAASIGADGLDSPPSEMPIEGALDARLVLGCPAHHEAEELSLSMLASLLKLDGCPIEVVSTKALPAEIERRVEEAKPALVFIAILPPGGLVQARFLCKRLRKRFPDLPIVVGFWVRGHNFDRLLVRLRAAGASYVTTSLIQSRSQVRALVKPTRPHTPPSNLQSTGGH